MPENMPVDQLSYETAFGELEDIVATLEGNQRPLDEAMALFERGQALATRCATLLDQAELKIRTLTPLPSESSNGRGVTGLTGLDRAAAIDEEPEE